MPPKVPATGIKQGRGRGGPISDRETRSSVRSKKEVQADLDESIEFSSESETETEKMAGKGEPKTELTQILEGINSLNAKFDNLHTVIFNPIEGIKPRLEGVSTDVEDHQERIEQLEAENVSLRRDVDILKGLAQKQSVELNDLRMKLDDQTARSMKKNIIIRGIVVDKEEGAVNYKTVAVSFLTDTLGLESVDVKEIYVAHEMGNDIIIKVSYDLKEQIFAKVFAGALTNKKNSKDGKYFVSEQLPESMQEAKRQARRESQALKVKYDDQYKDDPAGKPKVTVKRNRVYVNNELQKPLVVPPEPNDLFPSEDEQKKIDKVRVQESGVQGEKGSSFWAVAVKASNAPEVRRAYVKMRQTYPSATHIMAAYKFEQNGTVFYGYQDDKEFGGSHKIAECIDNSNKMGVAVFVMRKYGGVHIGKSRFEHITFCANEALGLL